MEMDKIIMELPVRPENAKKVIDALYDEPVINRKKLIELTNMKESTVKDTVNTLLKNNIIVETTGYTRNQVFAFQKYIDLFLK
jgi:DNA-binding MarR family transcriptional regulator